MRESQPKRAAMEPKPPGAPCSGPVRIGDVLGLADRESDRRAQRGGGRIERPDLASIGGTVSVDVTVRLPLEHQVAGRGQGAAVVRSRRRLLPSGRCFTGSQATRKLLPASAGGSPSAVGNPVYWIEAGSGCQFL